MRHTPLLLAAASLLLASCATHFVATDSLSRRLDVTRTLLAADTSALAATPYAAWTRTALDAPALFDFRTTRNTMRYAYSATLPRGGWQPAADSLPRALRPDVTVGRHRRLFTTRYSYSARFHAIDSLPVPLDLYLDPDEQQLLFQPSQWPADWNGADLYALLDRLNEKYARWLGHCMFEVEYKACMAELDSAQRRLLAAHHDTLLALATATLPDGQTTLRDAAAQLPALRFLADGGAGGWGANVVALDLLERFDANVRVLWRIELPGGRIRECMVSADRLLTGDYTVELHSDVVHWWAVALAVLLLAAAVSWLCMRRRNTL